MNILILNCGSSSLKYRIVRMPEEKEIVSGEAQRVGIKSTGTSFINHNVKGKEVVVKEKLADHLEAFKSALRLIDENHQTDEDVYFDFIAHRYVNALDYFSGTARIFSEDVDKLENTFDIAPLHNPIIYSLIKYCSEHLAHIPQYIVNDHSFHRTIPENVATYSLPAELTKKYRLRKMGYHGISHQYVMQESCKFLDKNLETQKIISCHLGTGGSSVCAIRHGKSVNSSMGFTPLEGLIMNTRSGNLDAGMIFHIMYNNGWTPGEAENLLNKKSGILSIYKESSDLRDALKRMDENPNASLALEMYVRRVKKYIGNYFIQLKKADVLIFTDSLGVEMPFIRNAICQGLEYFGIRIDTYLNNSYCSGIADISRKNSEVRILVVPTNEEIMIAREAYKELSLENVISN